MATGDAQPNVLNFVEERCRGLRGCLSERHWKSRVFQSSNEFYHKDLKAHFGCVNAIEFSGNDLLLASGGDDRRILIWNVNQALTTHMTHKVPNAMSAQHNSNIFCLSFNVSDSCIISGGNDGCIIAHDIKSGKPTNTYICTEAIYCISADPLNDSVFVAASHEGNALVYDVRMNAESLTFCEGDEPMHSVQYNPTAPRYIATVSTRHTAKLWDIRKPSRPVIEYKYSNGKYNGMSVSFNNRGDRLLVIGRWVPPLVYDITNPCPIHEFHSTGYYSACTIKSCCWAGPDNQYVATGSDDFSVYMWKVPGERTPDNYLVKSASKVLTGHRSVVNQVRYNDEFTILASSGVEKIVKAWSPFPISHSVDGAMTSSERYVYSHEEYLRLTLSSGTFMTHNYTMGCMEEDSRMMAFFDSLVQRQLEANQSQSSDPSEEASHRRYDHELSSTSSSSSTDLSDDNKRRGRNFLSSSEDSTGLGEMSPFTSAFAASILNTVGEGGPSPTPNASAPPIQPQTRVTMTELIRKRKQQDIDKSLALAKKKLRRQQRRAERERNRDVDSDSESDSSLTPAQRRKGKRRREKVRRILTRIGVNELRVQSTESQASTAPQQHSVEVNERLEELRDSWRDRSSTTSNSVLKSLRDGDSEEEFRERHNNGTAVDPSQRHLEDNDILTQDSASVPTGSVDVGASTSTSHNQPSVFKSRSTKYRRNIKRRTKTSSDSGG